MDNKIDCLDCTNSVPVYDKVTNRVILVCNKGITIPLDKRGFTVELDHYCKLFDREE